MLKGIGTRASKSRLTTLRCRELFSNAFRRSKGRQEGVSCFFGEKKKGEGRKRLVDASQLDFQKKLQEDGRRQLMNN